MLVMHGTERDKRVCVNQESHLSQPMTSLLEQTFVNNFPY